MTDYCVDLKTKLEDMLGKGLSDKAKLVALLEACGIAERDDLERLLECKPSTLREARAALKIQRRKSGAAHTSAGNPAPEFQRNAGNPALAPEIQRQNSSALSRANKEYPSDINITSESHTPPTPSVRIEGAREGEVGAGHGVFVNCETIRHRSFTISLPAIRMGTLASGLNAEQVKDQCLTHALQWAAEIEDGKLARDVLPGKIANFLSVSIMKTVNRSSHPMPRKPVNGGVAAELARLYGAEVHAA